MLGWDKVEVCHTRRGLSVVIRDGVEVWASAAFRRGGITESSQRRRELCEQQERCDDLRDTRPTPAVHPEYLAGKRTHRTNLDTGDAGTLIETYVEQVRSLLARATGDTTPGEIAGMTSSFNRPIAATAGLLAIAFAIVIALL